MTISTSVGYKEWMETDCSFCCFRQISCMKTMVVIFVWKGNYPVILNMCGLCTCSDVWRCVWGGSGGNGHVFVTLCEMFSDWQNVHNKCNNGLLLWSPHLFAKQKLGVVAHTILAYMDHMLTYTQVPTEVFVCFLSQHSATAEQWPMHRSLYSACLKVITGLCLSPKNFRSLCTDVASQ